MEVILIWEDFIRFSSAKYLIFLIYMNINLPVCYKQVLEIYN